MTTKIFNAVGPALQEFGYRLHDCGETHALWIRTKGELIRQELGLQDSSRDKGKVLGTLRISIRASVWGDVEPTPAGDDGFKDAVTREWGSNGVFHYGWQCWEGWLITDTDQLLQDLRMTALPWLDTHADPGALIKTLEQEVTQGYRAGPPREPLQRRLFGHLLLGKNYPAADRLVFPPAHKERLGELYFGLGDIPNAVRWLREWVDGKQGWAQRERYLRRVSELEAVVDRTEAGS